MAFISLINEPDGEGEEVGQKGEGDQDEEDRGGGGVPEGMPTHMETQATQTMELTQLKGKTMSELLQSVARSSSIQGTSGLRKQELIFKILEAQTEKNGLIFAEGVLEILPEGYGFLRSPTTTTCRARTTSTSRRRRSSASTCAPATRSRARCARPRKASATSRCCASRRSTSRARRSAKDKILFDNLTPLYPQEKLNLETKDRGIETRIIDLLCADRQGPARADRRRRPRPARRSCCRRSPTRSPRTIPRSCSSCC